MLFQDSYYLQLRIFYNNTWTKKIEVTFIDALVQQAKEGNFNRDGVNCHAILCAVHDMKKRHATTTSYGKGRSKVKILLERDHVWEAIIKRRNLAKCYVNAYDDAYDNLKFLFGEDQFMVERIFETTHGSFIEEDEVDSIASFAVTSGWVDQSPWAKLSAIPRNNMDELDSS
ncbi:UNVERIFIED_CONTAM: hypothetical protein Sradi_3178900 [Sesamum radiatum]|uniref:Uncharacterized protein n=1 Tax=Sesamum radiatum TaxID=300843 RepID=A0AAW2RFF4_SESRA